MSEGNGYNTHAIFALNGDGLAWVRRSATRDDPVELKKFIREKDELRYESPENVHIVRGDRDRYLRSPFIPREVFDRLVRESKLSIVA